MKISYLALATALIAHPAYAQVEDLGTSTVKEKLSETDKLKAADNQRVGESEGAQIISSDYIRAQQASTFADSLRKTTSVQIDEEGGAQGARVYIRGLSEDQVSVRVEGAPKNWNQTRHGGAGAIFLEPDMYKSITVVAGVSSNVYGNGSLGGVVLLETKDPDDVLKEGRTTGLNARVGYESNGDTTYLSADAAVKLNDNLAFNSTVTYRNFGAYVDGSGLETVGGATGTEDSNILLKGVLTPAPGHHIEASYIGHFKDYVARSGRSRGLFVASTDEFTELKENTFTIQYGYNPEDNLLIDLNTRFSSHETSRDRRADGSTDIDTWTVKTNYAEIENTSIIPMGDTITHELRVGADYTFDDILAAYGTATGGDLFRERTQIGGYISDTISLGENLTTVASVRFDNFKNTEGSRSISESGTSPKLGVYWSPLENTGLKGLQIFGVIGKGFRAPSSHEAFGRGEAVQRCSVRRGVSSCSLTIPNPDLKGEYSDSWETGFNFNRSGLWTASDDLTLKFTYINSDIKDFISTAAINDLSHPLIGGALCGTLTASGGDIICDGLVTSLGTFENVAEATINGYEVQMSYTNDHVFGSLTYQNMEGKDESTGLLLRNVSPSSLNATLGAYLFDQKSRVGVDFMSRDDFIYEPDERFNRVAYEIFDVFASYQFNDDFAVQFRVENVFDKLYTKRYRNLTVDIDGDPQDITYYQPGRNAKITLEYKF